MQSVVVARKDDAGNKSPQPSGRTACALGRLDLVKRSTRTASHLSRLAVFLCIKTRPEPGRIAWFTPEAYLPECFPQWLRFVFLLVPLYCGAVIVAQLY